MDKLLSRLFYRCLPLGRERKVRATKSTILPNGKIPVRVLLMKQKITVSFC